MFDRPKQNKTKRGYIPNVLINCNELTSVWWRISEGGDKRLTLQTIEAAKCQGGGHEVHNGAWKGA